MKKQTGVCSPNFEVSLLLLVLVMLIGSLIMLYNGCECWYSVFIDNVVGVENGF